jgi:16S rRNA processing protein RimM
VLKWDEMAVVGRVARAHGLKGQVIVNAETDFPDERFRPGAELFVSLAGKIERLTLTTVRFHRDRPVIGLQGVDDIDAASRLAGLELRIPADHLAPLPEGSYYWHDLIGCRVERSTGEPVGTVRAVEGGAGGSRLVIKTAAGDVLVPLAVEICRTIDTAGKRIVIEPPAGLLELNG